MTHRFCLVLLILLVLYYLSPVLSANESAEKYFPSPLGSYWVYEDQDGNELTRTAVEGEEIADKTYPAFSYQPELKDWSEYSAFIQPSLYNVSDAGITLVVPNEIEKATKARFAKEMEMMRDIIKLDDDANFTFNIEVQAEDEVHLLSKPITLNEEWDVHQIKVQLKINFEANDQMTFDYTIVQSGIVLGTETVETTAGIFEDCLKVKYQTETNVIITPEVPPDEVYPPGETATTVWYAPNVGIVKLQQKRKHTFLEMIPKDEDLPLPPDPKPLTLELKKFEIKTESSNE